MSYEIRRKVGIFFFKTQAIENINTRVLHKMSEIKIDER